MSDLGSEVGSQTAQISANAAIKLMEALGKLLGRSFEFAVEYNSAEKRKARMELKDMKFEADKKAFIKSLEFSAGEVNHAKLVKYDVPLVNFGIENGKMTEKEFREFSKICKDERVIMSGVKIKSDDGKPYYLLECRESDLEKIRHCMNKYNDKLVWAEMDKRLDGFKEKGLNNLSQGERLERADILNQKANILGRQNRFFNDTQTQSVIAGAYKVIEPEQRENFARAMNRIKDNYINKDLNFVVADMANPEMLMSSEKPATILIEKPAKIDK